ncbi:hypothetical protein [Ktedonospora formicarum]|uniref:Uncharacterized protein n=1 Tax=Ktedonospora formicarum TaxID=2778364 RepID=A0A8J3HZR3_9CHLR|nr:hypothetical protein [Ktedonospora formicarum]GHO44115.1 hypothetical protein KSX_22780 [Ktedonospora formicarum]
MGWPMIEVPLDHRIHQSLLEDGDVFGLGGWRITGKLPAQILPVFRETMRLVTPFLGREGVKRVHVWGVCYRSCKQRVRRKKNAEIKWYQTSSYTCTL